MSKVILVILSVLVLSICAGVFGLLTNGNGVMPFLNALLLTGGFGFLGIITYFATKD